MKYILFLILSIHLIVCKSIQVPEQSPRINLNKILMSSRESDGSSVVIRKNAKGDPFLELNLKYEGSGINVIEGIKSGEIWDHAVVVFDNEGNEIGREPINFQAFNLKMMETTTVEMDKQFVLSEDGTLFGKESTPVTRKSSSMDPNFQHKIYEDSDQVPQIIKLKSRPQTGSFISVLVELTYVAPFLGEVCDKNRERDCPSLNATVLRKVRVRNQLEMNRLQNSIREKISSSSPDPKGGDKDFNTTQESDLKFQSLSSSTNPNYKPRNFSTSESYCDTVESCRKDLQEEINSLNSRGYNVAEDGNQLYYREWNLVTLPRFFKVGEVEGVKKEKPVEEEVIDLNKEEKKSNTPRMRKLKPIDE